jgi:hypothetical protein
MGFILGRAAPFREMDCFIGLTRLHSQREAEHSLASVAT